MFSKAAVCLVSLRGNQSNAWHTKIILNMTLSKNASLFFFKYLRPLLAFWILDLVSRYASRVHTAKIISLVYFHFRYNFR